MINQSFIRREAYLEMIGNYIDKPVIKVITGMRRSGKSAILALLREELLERKVDEERIIFLNFESQRLAALADTESLYKYVTEYAQKSPGRLYILLDEVQRITGWERTVASFRVDFDCDIYVTGSNANLLSGELHTLLAGRFVEIPVYPLSFAEHLVFTKAKGEDGGKDLNTQFIDYLRYGGLPGIHEMDINSGTVYPYLTDIFNSVILKDVIGRHHIRDTELLERIVKFLMDNMGHIFSAKSISDFLKNQGRKLSTETVYNYLDALEEAFLIRKISRYDIKGKRQLETQEKYFFEDHGVKHAIQGYRDNEISGLLENLVCMELKRRGFRVYIGQLGQREVDFIALRREEKIYIQVCYLLSDSAVIEREFAPLLEIKDQYPKLVLSMDPIWDYTKEGVRRKNLAEWLIKKIP
ncbi:ATP-binding protein [Treponema primitia]|uniref:ATP-binding protein n=1 Tax=Treponema primitia TaxID=88058 RepID=UPI0039808450